MDEREESSSLALCREPIYCFCFDRTKYFESKLALSLILNSDQNTAARPPRTTYKNGPAFAENCIPHRNSTVISLGRSWSAEDPFKLEEE